MIRDSARLKRAVGKAKVDAAIEQGGGTALYAAHLLPHFGHLLPVLLATGVRMYEITSGSIWLDKHPPSLRLQEGGRYAARPRYHLVTVEEIVERIHQLREPLGEDVYLNVTPPGAANSIGPTRFTAEGAFQLAVAGADGLHVHLSSLSELKDLVDIAHGTGLLVEAYINQWVGEADEFSYMGIPAANPQEVADAGRAMEEIGVDIVGLMFSRDPKFYSLQDAGDSLPGDVDERLCALREAVSIPISVEGQVTPGNADRIREIGADIIVLGSHFDVAIEKALESVVADFGGARQLDLPSQSDISVN